MTRSTVSSRRAMVIAVGAVSALALAGLPTTAALGVPSPYPVACDNRNNNTIKKLLTCVSADGVMEHLEAFQAIADAHGGNRAVDTAGYEGSADYVIDVMTSAGWQVTEDWFDYSIPLPPELEQLTPEPATMLGSDAIAGAGAGEVTAEVVPVDIVLDPPRDNTSGCEAADFEGFPAGAIALVQRGVCTFGEKAAFAVEAGASAVIIFNQGNTPDREGPLTDVTLGSQFEIPVVTTDFAGGVSLTQPGATARVNVAFEAIPQRNIIAELPGRNDDNVVMAGAHLDSVPEGPGINDNASGSAALLELGQNLSKLKPQNTVRLAWWAAEEVGLIGSTSYVDRLPEVDRDRIALYLNFDMIGSPNYIFMIYDSDESGFEAPVVVPPGSVEIEDLFERYFTSVGEPYDDAEFSGRSDYAAFIDYGIPSGGLFTGAEEVKSIDQQEIWGGTAAAAFDPCYHQACDTLANIDLHALEVNSDAIALSVLVYSYSTELVNGVKGKSVPGGIRLPDPAGPEQTWSAGGGGLDHGWSG